MNPFSGKLTPQRERVLLCLMGRPFVSAELLAEVLWPHPDDMPDNWYNHINVLLTRIKKQIAPRWKIVNCRRCGWSLVSTSPPGSPARNAPCPKQKGYDVPQTKRGRGGLKTSERTESND